MNTPTEILSFVIRKIQPKRVPSKVKWDKECSMASYGPVTKTIYINRKSWNKTSNTIKKMVLLHELGHAQQYPSRQNPRLKNKLLKMLTSNDLKDDAKCELDAQIYAIKKAKKLGWISVASQLLQDLKQWEEFLDHPFLHRYALASLMAKKQKLI